MNDIWNQNGVSIKSIATVSYKGMEVWIHGMALKSGELLTWQASPNYLGWYVVVTSSSNRREEFQGSTFNLPLEVATACNRFL